MNALLKKLWERKGCLVFGVVIALFVFISAVSVSSIRLLQGNARVVNYVGIVRGATQKLIKEEIMGWHLSQTEPSALASSDWYPDDALIARLDSIIHELLTGEGPDHLVVLRDDDYLANMREVRNHWLHLKELIMAVRGGAKPHELFGSSQAYFGRVDETVFSAERYSEGRVGRINTVLIFINGIFIVMLLFVLASYLWSLTIRRRADALGKIAYVDALTGLNNRASCEHTVDRMKQSPPEIVSAFMFDMNDLKLTNDFFGHQGGDRIISAFGEILKESAREYGFIGRFGGDEFLGLFESGDASAAGEFLSAVSDGVERYNEGQTNNLEMIRYAVGYVIDDPRSRDIDDIIHEADNRMYANKRRLKMKSKATAENAPFS